MLSNLQAEMARHRICAAAIAAVIHRSTRTVSDKINGKVQFTVDEAFTVRDSLFPDLSLEYLFAPNGDDYTN